jgi:hypothetical protein
MTAELFGNVNGIQSQVVDLCRMILREPGNCATDLVMSRLWTYCRARRESNGGRNPSGSFRPKSVGRYVGRKFGVLYDEYAKYKVLSA